MSERLFHVGKIVNTHGVQGEVRVKRMTDIDDRFNVGNVLFIKQGDSLHSLTIKSHRVHQQYDLITFEGYESIEDVESFKQAYLHVKQSQLKQLPEGRFYHHEIIGCEVVTTADEKIGVVDHILSPGANDVWVTKQPDGKEVLIPYIKDIVKQVNVDERKILIEMMEGLLD